LPVPEEHEILANAEPELNIFQKDPDNFQKRASSGSDILLTFPFMKAVLVSDVLAACYANGIKPAGSSAIMQISSFTRIHSGAAT